MEPNRVIAASLGLLIGGLVGGMLVGKARGAVKGSTGTEVALEEIRVKTDAMLRTQESMHTRLSELGQRQAAKATIPDRTLTWLLTVFVVGVIGSSLSAFLADNFSRWTIFISAIVIVVVSVATMPRGILDRSRYGPTPLVRAVAAVLLISAVIGTIALTYIPGDVAVKFLTALAFWLTALLLIWRSLRSPRTLTQVLWSICMLLAGVGIVISIGSELILGSAQGAFFVMSALLGALGLLTLSAGALKADLSESHPSALAFILTFGHILYAGAALFFAAGLWGTGLRSYTPAVVLLGLVYGLRTLAQGGLAVYLRRLERVVRLQESSIPAEEPKEPGWALVVMYLAVGSLVVSIGSAIYASIQFFEWPPKIRLDLISAVFLIVLVVGGIGVLVRKIFNAPWFTPGIYTLLGVALYFSAENSQMKNAGMLTGLAGIVMLLKVFGSKHARRLRDETQKLLTTLIERDDQEDYTFGDPEPVGR